VAAATEAREPLAGTPANSRRGVPHSGFSFAIFKRLQADLQQRATDVDSGERSDMSDHAPGDPKHEHESPLLHAQEHQGYGEDEGEREELLEDDDLPAEGD